MAKFEFDVFPCNGAYGFWVKNRKGRYVIEATPHNIDGNAVWKIVYWIPKFGDILDYVPIKQAFVWPDIVDGEELIVIDSKAFHEFLQKELHKAIDFYIKSHSWWQRLWL